MRVENRILCHRRQREAEEDLEVVSSSGSGCVALPDGLEDASLADE